MNECAFCGTYFNVHRAPNGEWVCNEHIELAPPPPTDGDYRD